MTKSDREPVKNKKPQTRKGTRFTIQFPNDIIKNVEDERIKREYKTTAPIYVEGMRFFFKHKDDPKYSDSPGIDVLVEGKMDAYFDDPNRLEKLRRRLFNV
jgi:hypothetical protein